MHASEYKNIYLNEQTHFYYVGYHKIALSLLNMYLPKRKKSHLNILDVGCGTGLFLSRLKRLGKATGVDVNKHALNYASKRGLDVIKANATKLPFPNNTFDLVVSLDVIYHKSIEKDQRAYQEFYRVLKPKGLLLIKLPAFRWLTGTHDLLVHGKKRYTALEIINEFNLAHFSILRITYLGIFLVPIVLFKNFIDKIRCSTPAFSSVGKMWLPLNLLFIYFFKIEDLILHFINIPLGISIMAIGQKNSSKHI